jgi:glycosyltransferase involved in cell wall biosynthesis
VIEKPFLSVVMPVHEGAAWIGATLDSLAAEPTGSVEIIVIDSSPTSATADIVERFVHRLPLRLLQRRDLGPWQTKTNLGVGLAAADHVCMLHQDDLWLPGRVEAARRWLADAPEAALHLAPTAIIDRYGRRMGRWNCPLPAGEVLGAEFLLERLLVQNFVSVPAPIFRRSTWLACGGMDERLWYTADWDIWAKLASTGPVVYHDEITTAFRVHGSSLTVTGSRDASEFQSQMQIVLERHLPRLPASSRRWVEPAARASISVNVSLAAASGGNLKALVRAARVVLSLGPIVMSRYLRDSRLRERAVCRLRAKLTGAF